MKKIVLIAMLAMIFVPAKLSNNKDVRVAGTGILTPTLIEDTYVTTANQSGNYGNETSFTVGLNPDGRIYKGYIKFDTLYFPANATIDSAYLKLDPRWCSGNPSVTNLYIAAVNGNWSESTLTWNNTPDSAGFVTVNSACNDGYANYSIKTLVEDWKSGRVPQKGLIVAGPMTGTHWYRNYATSENTRDPKPILQVTWRTPESVPSLNDPVPPASGSTSSSSSGGGTSSSGSTTTGNSSSGGSSSTAADTPTSNTHGSTPSSSSNGLPTKAELDALVKDLAGGAEGMNFWDRLFASWFYIGPIIGFLFWALVIGLIALLVHRHKKKKLATSATPVKTSATTAPASKETPTENENISQSSKVDTVNKAKGK